MPMYSPEQERRVREALRTEIQAKYRNQAHFAHEHGMHKGWIGEFLGERNNKHVTRGRLEQIAKALGTDPDELIMVREKSPPRPAAAPVAREPGERITDPQEMALIYLSRVIGVKQTLDMIRSSQSNKPVTLLDDDPTAGEIARSKKPPRKSN